MNSLTREQAAGLLERAKVIKEGVFEDDFSKEIIVTYQLPDGLYINGFGRMPKLEFEIEAARDLALEIVEEKLVNPNKFLSILGK